MRIIFSYKIITQEHHLLVYSVMHTTVCDGIQILEQATMRLDLPSAARRLYTNDGLIILDLDDLVDWVRDEYVREARAQLRREARAKRKAATVQSEGGEWHTGINW